MKAIHNTVGECIELTVVVLYLKDTLKMKAIHNMQEKIDKRQILKDTLKMKAIHNPHFYGV